ncbi:MAG TPA: Rrf2 family transcriptional regulator [Rhodoferax sp.]
MRLTQWTDYTLRVLMYCAASQQRAQPVTITEIADSHGISRSHLTKVVQNLAGRGWLETTRGRGGGMRLLKPAQDICLGEVVRATETDFAMVECFEAALNQCRLSQHCHLKNVLAQATQSYLAVLDGVTLADLVAPATAGTTTRSTTKIKRLKLIPGLPAPSA